jgi:hypothetical protein
VSVLDRLNLPANFGYALLILGLVLVLAPYLRGTDFGVVKIPDFEAPMRRTLRVVGPLALLGAVLVHVPLAEQGGSLRRGSASRIEPGTVPAVPPIHTLTTLQPGDAVLSRRGTGQCLYPATVLGLEGDQARVRFAFGQDGEVPALELVGLPDGPADEVLPGQAVFTHLATAGVWAPGEVKELRDGRALVGLDQGADCAGQYLKDHVWTSFEKLIVRTEEHG